MVNKKVLVFALLLILSLALALASTFFYTEKCENFSCFQEAMRECSRKYYLNDATDATWRYEIKGIENGECRADVRLLQLKAGDIEYEKLRGYEMSCFYPRGVANYPEKNLDKCHGRLKEELQTIMIKKLHTYIINNIGEIDEGLKVLSG